MKRTLVGLVFVFIASTAVAQTCDWILISEATENWAGQDVIVEDWQYECFDSVDVSAPAPPPDSSPPPPPPDPTPLPPPSLGDLPQVWIDSFSDESPFVPKLNVGYSGDVAAIYLFRDGEQIATITPPATEFTLPGLDNMVASSTTFTLEAENSAGTAVAVDSGSLSRPSAAVRASGDFLLQYFDRFAGAEGDYVIAHYYHSAGSNITYANWDHTTVGARNGRVLHEQAEDSLFWDNTNIQAGNAPSPYPTVFDVSYWMTPYVGSDRSVLTRCSASGLTTYGFYNLPSITDCDQPAQFAVDGCPSATYTVDGINATNAFPPPPAYTIGDTTLTVRP